MGYYVRALCTSAEVPSLRAILDWVAQQGMTLGVVAEASDVDLDSPGWNEASIRYKEDKEPFESDIARDDGTPDSLFRDEVREFQELLEGVADSPAKDRVLLHLAQSRYLVANRLLSDVDGDGHRASAFFLEYFVRHAGGMVQADGEGFYEGDSLIIRLA